MEGATKNMIFDSHAHYDDEAFDGDREQLLADMPKNNIHKIVNVGASMKTSKASIELSEKYDFIYASVGVHPSETEELNMNNLQILKEYCKKDKVVAIGEIGLDYYYPTPEKDIQMEWFCKQLDLAAELELPVIIHSREAAMDTMKVLKEYQNKLVGGVIHCYSYSPEMAKEFVKMGYYIGVGGVVTFKNAKKLLDTVIEIPIEKIVIETDCPYLAPVPNRGERNSSFNLKYVINKLAQIKGISEKEITEITYKNAIELYRISI